MEKFLEFVAEIMEVDVSEISMETLYKEGKWDSLMMLTLVMELEAKHRRNKDNDGSLQICGISFTLYKDTRI